MFDAPQPPSFQSNHPYGHGLNGCSDQGRNSEDLRGVDRDMPPAPPARGTGTRTIPTPGSILAGLIGRLLARL